jgi:hypothetical protein
MPRIVETKGKFLFILVCIQIERIKTVYGYDYNGVADREVETSGSRRKHT